jgi:hypothetical protein
LKSVDLNLKNSIRRNPLNWDDIRIIEEYCEDERISRLNMRYYSFIGKELDRKINIK